MLEQPYVEEKGKNNGKTAAVAPVRKKQGHPFLTPRKYNPFKSPVVNITRVSVTSKNSTNVRRLKKPSCKGQHTKRTDVPEGLVGKSKLSDQHLSDDMNKDFEDGSVTTAADSAPTEQPSSDIPCLQVSRRSSQMNKKQCIIAGKHSHCNVTDGKQGSVTLSTVVGEVTGKEKRRVSPRKVKPSPTKKKPESNKKVCIMSRNPRLSYKGEFYSTSTTLHV